MSQFPIKETAVIREEMLRLRSRLPESVQSAKREAEQLTDWKYYVGKFPLISAGIAAGLAYSLVPKARPADHRSSSEAAVAPSAKASVAAVASGFAMNLALKAASRFVSSKLDGLMSDGIGSEHPDLSREQLNGRSR